jgi:hypothetical protein
MTERLTAVGGWLRPTRVYENVWFPGRWIGGVGLIAGPVFWFAGLLLRYLAFQQAQFSDEQLAQLAAQPFAAPGQLAAYMANPALVTAGYAAFLAGVILLFPAFSALARLVAVRSPGLASWGATLFILSLFARAYWAGVDHTAFQWAEAQRLDQVTTLVLGSYVDISYGPWRIPVTLAFGQYLGVLLLAIGAYRSRIFGLGRTLMFVYWGTIWVGVLKASHLADVLGAVVLCVVLVPMGVQVLRDRIPDLRVRNAPAVVAGRRLLSW